MSITGTRRVLSAMREKRPRLRRIGAHATIDEGKGGKAIIKVIYGLSRRMIEVVARGFAIPL